VIGAVQGLLVAVSCRGVPRDGAWPTHAVFRRQKFFPTVALLFGCFCMFCIFLSLFHSLPIGSCFKLGFS
jgi:hypothetical protein